jgi:hypothetical protein
MQINRCPKCGRNPSIIRFRAAENFNSIPKFSTEVKCYVCAVSTGLCETHAKAVKKWNEMTKGITK